NGLAQLSRLFQNALPLILRHVTALDEFHHAVKFQRAAVFTEAQQISITRQQFLGRGVTVVKRVDEIEREVARNQFKPRRTPAGESFHRSILYLTVKMFLTS